jgi:Fe-S cluster assembly protein SufD
MNAPPSKPIPPLLVNRLGNWVESGHAGPLWLTDRRRAALDAFVQNGLPTRKTETWKYNDINPVVQPEWNFPPLDAHRHASGNALAPLLHADDLNIVFINGIYSPDLSNAQGEEAIAVTSLRSPLLGSVLEALLDRPDAAIEAPFAALNRAAWRDGIALSVNADAVVRRRIHLLMLHEGDTANALITPRLYLRAGMRSESFIAITYASSSGQRCLNVPCIDIDLDDAARLTLCQTQVLNRASFHIGATRIHLGRDSVLHSLDAAFGAAFSRHNLTVAIDGSGSEAVLNGIYTMRGTQQTDVHSIIEHRLPNSRSRQVYKGILDGQATAVFNGAVRVSPGACGTDGYQLNRTLLRSPDARIFTKPELEIANDDVRCTHGATVGQLDPQQVFYLQSRGIAADDARNLLARGFVEDILFALTSRRQREMLDRELDLFFDGDK